MRHGSLFSGIGGFDLAAEWMGWENVFHCEWNPFGQKILHYYWPKAISYEDITKTDFTIHRGNIDLISGGFPCQPYSMAGKRRGKDDERHLWPEMLRAIREIQPRWVVGENVRGLTNWNAGVVFDEVCADLENLGYQVAPYIIPASALNAPHQRERIWFVAYSESNGRNGREHKYWEGIKNNQRELCEYTTKRSDEIRTEFERYSSERNAADSNRNGFNECNSDNEVNTSEGRINAFSDFNESNDNGDAADTNTTRCENRPEQYRGKPASCREGEHCTCGYCIGIDRDAADSNTTRCKTFNNQKSELGKEDRTKPFSRNSIEPVYSKSWWHNFPTQSPVCSGDDGLSTKLDGITFSKWRAESIKGYGNAIVPQVVFQIFKAIEEYDRATSTAQDH